ncbi:MAG: hypothetical protein ACPHCN_16135 [Mycobacterium sp.]
MRDDDEQPAECDHCRRRHWPTDRCGDPLTVPNDDPEMDAIVSALGY